MKTLNNLVQALSQESCKAMQQPTFAISTQRQHTGVVKPSGCVPCVGAVSGRAQRANFMAHM